MVAKSFLNFIQHGEPFEKNGKTYIKVENPKTHTTREVRWYTEREFAKMYPEMEEVVKTPVKEIMGFKEGYITLLKCDPKPIMDWIKENAIRYNGRWGWYINGGKEIPTLPSGVEAIVINWSDVSTPDGVFLKPDNEIRAFIDSLIYDPTPSEYQGEIGERIERELTLINIVDLPDGFYGPSKMYIWEDASENRYVWTTSPKAYEIGVKYKVRGTVKDHRVFKASKQTILSRCYIKPLT